MDDKQSESKLDYHDPSQMDSSIRSLKELIDHASGRKLQEAHTQQDSGLVEILPFPFLALVGQVEMKYALLLALD